MKTVLSLCLSALATASLAAQGSLTPPGAPAPTQKTLDQIEARTPISSLPFSITAAGSYYLTGNLSVTSGNGITISADQVTLDLNGFAISSTANPAGGAAITLPSTRRNVAIKNGFIRGTTTFSAGVFTAGGFSDGIFSASATTANVRVQEISVYGVGSDGITFSTTGIPTALIERCSVTICGGVGILAGLVRDCSADTTGSTAVSGEIVTNSYGETVNTASTLAFGIASSTAENCRGVAVSGSGIGSVSVSNSRGVSGAGSGISAASVANCEGTSSTGPAGILASGGTVSFSRGRRDGGSAISCTNAIGCTVTGTGTVTATNKSLGTP